MSVPGHLYTEEFIRTHQKRPSLWSSKMQDWFATTLNMGDTLSIITRRYPDNGLLRPALDISASPDYPDTFSVSMRPEYEQLEPLIDPEEDGTENLGTYGFDFGPTQAVKAIYLCKTIATVCLFGGALPNRTLADRYGTVSVARDDFGQKRLLVVQMPSSQYAGIETLEFSRHKAVLPHIPPQQ